MDHGQHWDVALIQVQQDVAKYGWHLENVFAHWHGMAYSHTVGLVASFNHPELGIFGLKPSVADLALVRAVNEIRSGVQFGPGKQDDTLLTGCLCEFVPVSDEDTQRLLPLLARYYGDQNVPVLQIIWPHLKTEFPQHGNIAPLH